MMRPTGFSPSGWMTCPSERRVSNERSRHAPINWSAPKVQPPTKAMAGMLHYALAVRPGEGDAKFRRMEDHHGGRHPHRAEHEHRCLGDTRQRAGRPVRGATYAGDSVGR